MNAFPHWLSRGCHAFAAIAATMAMSLPALAQEREPIRIGLILPFKGVYAEHAASIERGFQLALDEAGGTINGHRIEVVKADDELSPAVAVQKFNKLVLSDKVSVVAGVIPSNVAIALTELAERNKVPTVFSMAFADEVTGKFCNPYVARTSYSANAYNYAAGAYWAKQGRKTAVTLGPDYAAGHAFLGAFKRGFEDNGGKVVQQIWSPFQKTKDWSGYLSSAKSSGAEFIFGFYAGSEAMQVVRQYSDLGLRGSMPLIGDQFLYDESFWPSWGELALGAKHLSTHSPDLPAPASRAFVEAFRKKYNTLPDVTSINGYDNGKAIVLALKKLGGPPKDGLAFMNALAGVEYDSPRGRFRFNKDRNAVLDKIYLVDIVKGADGKLTRKVLDTMPGASDLPGCAK